MANMTTCDATSKNHQLITERINRTGWLIESTKEPRTDDDRPACQARPTQGHPNVAVVVAALATVALALWLVGATPLA